MVLKQKGKPEKGKKPVRGGPRQFSDHREFPDGPIEEFENLRVRKDEQDNSESESEEGSGSEYESSSSSEAEPIVASNKPRPATNNTTAKPAGAKPQPQTTTSTTGSNGPKEMTRREREALQKEQARQHYLKMKEMEDSARLALVRKQREEAAAAHAEALRAKEAAKKR